MYFRNGNCLYRAAFIILFGNEDHHTGLCMRWIFELASDEKKYLDDNYLQSLMGASDFVKKSLPSSVHFISKNPSLWYQNKVLGNVRPANFANMWHFLALANVLRCPVQLVYPDVQNVGTNRALWTLTQHHQHPQHPVTNKSLWCGVIAQTQQRRDGVQSFCATSTCWCHSIQ